MILSHDDLNRMIVSHSKYDQLAAFESMIEELNEDYRLFSNTVEDNLSRINDAYHDEFEKDSMKKGFKERMTHNILDSMKSIINEMNHERQALWVYELKEYQTKYYAQKTDQLKILNYCFKKYPKAFLL